ncbi:MAG: (d)CMP kinase [Actinomycetota bacterium]
MERSTPLPTDADLRIIAIDGPAGSGKSTVAKRLADAVDLDYLDTGAMYRAVTWAAMSAGVDPADHEVLVEIATEADIDLGADGTVVVNGEDATAEIRFRAVTQLVSVVAANPDVRSELVARQREWARKRGGGVLEGRDIGTVVFPTAKLKVYLTASSSARAARRARDENTSDTRAVEADLDRRDALDSQRKADPLQQADDSYVLDTSDLTIDEVVDHLIEVFRERQPD